MSESNEREQVVAALLRQLWLGLSAYRLFPGALDRPGFVAALERIEFAAQRALAFGPVDVEVHGDRFHLDGAPLPEDETIERLARACFERRAERLVVQTVPDARDLDLMFSVLSKPVDEIEEAGGPEAILRDAGVTSVALGRQGPAPVAGADHVPEELEAEPPAAVVPIPDASTLRADLLFEDMGGSPTDQAEMILERFRSFVGTLPEPQVRDVDMFRAMNEVVTELPPDRRRALMEVLVERVRDDPLAERLIGTMSNAELTRALVDLGRDGRHDPVELARQLSSAGIRATDIVDLTAALEAGHEEAGTIVAGLEQLGIDLSDRAQQPAPGESITDVLARYLLATQQDDLRSMEGLIPSTDEQRRTYALAALEDYLRLESDLEELGEVLELWSREMREALRNKDQRRVERLFATARAALDSNGDVERAAVFHTSVREAIDASVLSKLLEGETDIETSTLPSLLSPFGAAAVDALLDLLAEEEDRHNRAVVLAVLRRISAGHLELVTSRVSDPRWYVVRNAVNILRSAGGTEILDVLAAAARHSARPVRWEATWGLVAAGGVDAIPYLQRLITEQDPEVRTLAVEALGGLVAPEAVAALVGVVRSSRDLAIGRRALDELAAHPSPAAAEAIHELASRRARPRLPRALRRHARALVKQQKGERA